MPLFQCPVKARVVGLGLEGKVLGLSSLSKTISKEKSIYIVPYSEEPHLYKALRYGRC